MNGVQKLWDEPLCRALRRRIGRALGRYRMITEGNRIVVGLSGGKDSLLLLHALSDLRRRSPVRFELAVCTVALTGIVRESKADLLPALERFEAQLAAFRMALVTDDAEALAGLFETASGRRGALPAQGGGALAAEALIQIELQDRPGEIAVVSTLLAVRGINIKNIGMVHARQYEGGRIQLYLSSGNQAAAALDILRGAGYECC